MDRWFLARLATGPDARFTMSGRTARLALRTHLMAEAALRPRETGLGGYLRKMKRLDTVETVVGCPGLERGVFWNGGLHSLRLAFFWYYFGIILVLFWDFLVISLSEFWVCSS